MYWLAWLSSVLATVLRLGAGYRASGQVAPNKEPLILYEFEGCPFCKIAREQVSASGVRVEMRPCPKSGDRYRPELVERGGKAQFPYLIDPNTGTEMYESADIARYIRQTYGGRRPLLHWLGPINQIIASYSILVRLFSGVRKRSRTTEPANKPEFLLKGSEWGPASRLVKEALCSKQINYIWDPSQAGTLQLVSLADGTTIQTGSKVIKHLKTL